MNAVMPDAMCEMDYFIPQERGDIDMRKNEFNVLNILIETCTEWGEEAHSMFRLVSRERKKSSEEYECDENEDKIRHGDWRAERRAKRPTRMRSPNFCVASFKRSHTVLLSSLMNDCSRST